MTENKMTAKEGNYLDGYDKDVCGFCGEKRTPEGHDGCIGTLEGVMNACCGHGEAQMAYVQFNNETRIEGEEALKYIKNQNRMRQLLIEVGGQFDVVTEDDLRCIEKSNEEFDGFHAHRVVGYCDELVTKGSRKKFALQVATEAVEEELNEECESLTNIGKQIHDLTCDRILINIKKQLNDE